MDKIKVAIIDTGNRTRKVYTPLFKSLNNEIDIVADTATMSMAETRQSYLLRTYNVQYIEINC